MRESLSEKVIAQIGKAAELYHRLVLIVAPSGSGKTAVLQNAATRSGAPLLNLNLELSRRMLDLTERQRGIPHVLAGHWELPLRGLRERLAHQAADRTIQEDLAHLRRLGLVEAAGRGRGARYWLRRTRDE
ncbi:MAG: BREX-3 system P-loop-containing protein BrxF [Candidatus Eisenbacteria sp.]|nr:BREX-3 system P-loop-containing protein BrxF [Candidatus Eisenbacteria bacterium]